MSFIVSLDSGDSSTKAPAATSTPAATSSAPAKSPTASPTPAKTSSPIVVNPVASTPANTPANTAPSPAPSPTAADDPSNAPSQQNPAPPPSSTIIPSISIAPQPKNSPQSQPPPRPASSNPLILTPVASSPGSDPTESITGIVLPPVVPSNSKSTAPPSASTGNPKGSPFEGTKGSAQSDKPVANKKSGSTIAGVVGGLSAAVLLGIILFFVWKWKTRGRYRFNKRTSFGPYGNGIDANRGGLLVSAVPPKNGDGTSVNEAMYEKDEPNRYRRPSEDPLNRQPTIPQVGGSPERSYAIPQPPRTVMFDVQEPAQPYPTDAALMAIHPAMRPQQPRQPGQPGVFFERRKLPAPPSMRRNPGQNANRHNRSFSASSADGISPVDQSGSSPVAGAAGAGMGNSPVREAGSPPYPVDPPGAEYPPYGPPPRSYTLGGQLARAAPGAGSMALAANSQRRVRRSMSLGGMSTRYRNPFLDPLSMHPVIQEVPSGQSSPMKELDTLDFQNHPASLQPGVGRSNSVSQAGRDRPSPQLWNRPDSTNRVLTVRNIPSPTPPAASAEKSQKPLNNMMSRMGSIRDHNGFRVQDAAKNF